VAEGRERASFYAERSDADFLAVRVGRCFFLLFLFSQRRFAPDGTHWIATALRASQ
jgi:hypothetical protein